MLACGVFNVIRCVISVSDKVIFKVTGHAPGTGDGWNILCGLASMLANVAATGCSENCDYYKEYSYGKGELEFECERNDRTVAIVRAIEAGFDDLRDKYPGCFE